MAGNYFSTLTLLLRDRQDFLVEIQNGIRLKDKIASLLMISCLFFAIYGGIIGASNNPLQILSSAIKLPALYLITLTVCLPTLYIFNALFGAKQTIAQNFALLLTSVAVIAVLLLGFAPVTLFFLITVQGYRFFLLLNVAIFTLTGILGVSFLYQVMKPISDSESSEGAKVRTNILRFWLVLYGFVGSQLGWTLRPFFGDPHQAFQLFRGREGNFFSGVFDSIRSLLF